MPKEPRKHHIEYAHWGEGGKDHLIADFSHADESVRHFMGAEKNLRLFGKLKIAADDKSNDKVIFDRNNLEIHIIGKKNCDIFNNWIAEDCPPLNERFAESNIQFGRSWSAFVRDSVEVEINPSPPSHMEKTQPSEQSVSGGLNGFDPPGKPLAGSRRKSSARR